MQHEVWRAVAVGGGGAELEPAPGLARAPMADLPPGGQNLDTTQVFFEPERVENAGAVRADLDSGAHLLELGRLLVNFDVEAAPQQRQRRREPADRRR